MNPGGSRPNWNVFGAPRAACRNCLWNRTERGEPAYGTPPMARMHAEQTGHWAFAIQKRVVEYYFHKD